MPRISIINRAIRAAAAGLVLIAPHSPVNAAYQDDADLPISTTTNHADARETNSAVARNRSIALTSRLPWLAPVGHRQPQQADVPRSKSRVGMGASATAVRPGAGPQADHLSRLLTLRSGHSRWE
ncbi:hypothetical protein QA640_47490 (plasmid) [Bradyrhizobium sp. CB82]|uniref:hypothetical protein n=1 Tax=Bradyrhizobium sp. CB82 TaxID=3039159 RepID=UPI0024B09726|nr:hypothetical protein [Bradyrhizobium sp. CB82]WFU45631.1 hypothetical protein QA640_47490 [Bradyrhizobium sp. CB82]